MSTIQISSSVSNSHSFARKSSSADFIPSKNLPDIDPIRTGCKNKYGVIRLLFFKFFSQQKKIPWLIEISVPVVRYLSILTPYFNFLSVLALGAEKYFHSIYCPEAPSSALCGSVIINSHPPPSKLPTSRKPLYFLIIP